MAYRQVVEYPNEPTESFAVPVSATEDDAVTETRPLSPAYGGPPVSLPVSPGYKVPDLTAVKGIPLGAKWQDVDPSVAMVRHGNPFKFAKDSAPQYFNDAAYNRQVLFHSAHAKRTGHDFENQVLDHLEEFVKLVGSKRCMFVGEADLDFPWLKSTDSVAGPTTLTYTVTHSITRTESETSGWAVGGSLGVTLGKDPVKVAGTVTFQYSHSWTDSTSWTDGDSTGSSHPIPAGKSGRVDVYSLAGR
ncbi:hypothetical protein [Streptomyces sp. NPDC054797]